MCDYNNLSANENGFILRCRQCGYYQVSFAGIMLSLNLDDYDKFSHLIEYLSEKEIPEAQWNARHIVIPTPYFGVNLLLCKNEIEELQMLISQAASEQIAQSMMALFANN